MAKLKRGELKQIVKECLVEILAEGLEGGNQTRLSESRTLSTPSRPRRTQKKPQQIDENPKFDRAVSRNVSALTDDPMMAALFEDTARGTFQDQLSNEVGPGQVSMTETAAPGADLSDVFGSEASQNWAALAFDSAPKKL